MMRPSIAPLALLLLAPGAAGGGPGQGPSVLLETLAGEVERRDLEGFSTRDPRLLGASFLRFDGLGPAPEPSGAPRARAEIGTHAGDRLVGWIVGGDEENLRLVLHGEAPAALSIEEVASVVFPERGVEGLVPTPPESGDRLYLARGQGLDKVDGVLTSFSSEGLRFEGRLGEHPYPWEEVAALFVEDLGEAAPEPGAEAPSVPVVVELPAGGRVSGGLVRIDAEGVTVETPLSRLFFPAALVREVSVDDGSFRFLSEVPVADGGPVTLFGGEDDLGMVYRHRVDKNCLGGPLRSAGRTWARGLGVHAPSRLTWRLDGAWATLRGQAAVDDSALENRHHGSVIFRVHADGELVWQSPLLRGGEAPLSFVLPLEGVEELVLEVDPATDSFVSDRAIWLRVLLVGG